MNCKDVLKQKAPPDLAALANAQMLWCWVQGGFNGFARVGEEIHGQAQGGKSSIGAQLVKRDVVHARLAIRALSLVLEEGKQVGAIGT